MRRCLFLSFLLPLLIACPQPKKFSELVVSPVESAISVLITSVPDNVEILFEKSIVSTPARFKIKSIEQLLTGNIKATNKIEAVEQRIKIYSDEEIELILIFDSEFSKVPKTLGLANILVFDYSEGITFDFNKYEIRPNFKPLLITLADMLKKYFDGIDIYICGHSDSVGRREYNLGLSLNRAKSVYDELLKLGVKGANMNVQGFGSDYPLVSNDTEAGRAQNRRIEVILGR